MNHPIHHGDCGDALVLKDTKQLKDMLVYVCRLHPCLAVDADHDTVIRGALAPIRTCPRDPITCPSE